MKDLIKQLEEYRLENRISQEKLADILGVAFVTVNRWFNGRQKPSQIQVYQIKKFLAGKGPKK
jgi:transcriptional regulator with XRE-family HTH domain